MRAPCPPVVDMKEQILEQNPSLPLIYVGGIVAVQQSPKLPYVGSIPTRRAKFFSNATGEWISYP